MIKKIVTTLAILLALAFSGYLLIGGLPGIVALLLPDFPDYPEPTTQLNADSSGTLYFASSTPFDLDVILRDPSQGIPTTGKGTLFLPAQASADSPVPAMVLLHGSGGISPGREMEYGQQLADNGYAAFVVDYYDPRGATLDTPYMIRVISITEFDAITDGYAALKLLRTHPAIDPEKIGVMGFSYGGMATRFSMDDRIRAALMGEDPGFALHIDYYGPCFQNLQSTQLTGGPILTLRGDDDASNDLEACKKREHELRELGADVSAFIFPGAGHAWESTRPRALSEDSPYLQGCEMVYDEQGLPSVDGNYIIDTPVETPRAERIAMRMTSGTPLQACVRYGYIVGRDDKTKGLSDEIMLRFLNKHFE